MPVTKEFTVNMEDRPGTLGKFCGVLADKGINIVAFETISFRGRSEVRFIADDPAAAKSAMDRNYLTYTEERVAQVELANRPGELARAASLLGDAGININYAYSGVDAKTNAPLMFVGVEDPARAAQVLEEGTARRAA